MNIHEAKRHLSRLLEQAVNGEEIVIVKSGKPVVKLVSFEEPCLRLGFLEGKSGFRTISTNRFPMNTRPVHRRQSFSCQGEMNLLLDTHTLPSPEQCSRSVYFY
ncbi:hypothetical protein LptCag_0025 [Leptospirillum ferriphilum]|uniref:Antitoxin n=1 Tax=Leptospirillum ferriphilum TaxID=178606 RepID=A0A094WCM7_9BACT|nr:type II toxin-antitoxin system prevent-host-death family antitoxin [Leptospirillum ferriphilum]KGA93412.1 hypothetical protein LptCag_0025 [Leptospirillum ferriphilum]